jgi:hypothetical protein
VKIQAEVRRKASNRSGGRRQDLRYRRVSAKDIGEAVFHDNRNFDIRPRMIQDLDGRRGQNAVAERTQTDNRRAAVQRKLFEDIGLNRHAVIQLLFIDDGLIDQHDGDVVPHRIEAMTGDAAQTAAIRLEFNFGAAGGANENFEQIGADRHV